MAEARSRGNFPTTNRQIISQARSEDEARRKAGLGFFYQVYSPPIEHFLVSYLGVKEEEAKDRWHSFVAVKVMRQNVLARWDAGRGKFRTFLLKALSNHLKDEHAKETAQRRAPPAGKVSLDDITGEEPTDKGQSPEAAWTTAWIRGLLDLTFKLAKKECEARGQQRLWRLIEARILRPFLDGAEPVPYKDLARELGYASETKACNAFTTAWRKVQRIFREQVGEYEDDIDGEIRDMLSGI
jgi:hypothetical protein